MESLVDAKDLGHGPYHGVDFWKLNCERAAAVVGDDARLFECVGVDEVGQFGAAGAVPEYVVDSDSVDVVYLDCVGFD